MARRLSVKNLETGALTCRTIGHAWEPIVTYVNRERDTMHRWEVMLRCSRCNTERADLVDSQGRMVGRAYSYPDGYRAVSWKDYGGRAGFTAQARVALFGRLATSNSKRR